MKFFMLDFLEFNLRKVMIENTQFCSQKCNLFEDIKIGAKAETTKVSEKNMLSCFEKCLGKFSDSYESAVDIFGNHLKTLHKSQVFTHSQNEREDEGGEKRFLLGQGIMDPVYDKPMQKKQTINTLRKRKTADEDFD